MSAEPGQPSRVARRLLWPLLTVALIVLLVVLLVVFSPRLSRDDRRGAGVVVGGDAPNTQLVVRMARPLTGTNLVRIDIGINSPDMGSFGSSYGSTNDRRNILLLDRTSGAARRLLPDNERRIETAHFLPAQANYSPDSQEEAISSGADAPPPAYFVLLVARAGQRDRFDLLVGSLAGPEQAFVLREMEGLDGLWMQSPTQLGLLVRERQALFYRIVDLPTLRIVQSRRIAI